AGEASCHSESERNLPMRRTILTVCITAAAAALAAESLLINGAGATFPFPPYSKWFSGDKQKHPQLKFKYQAIAYRGGMKQITEGTVDFGASDAPMTDEELSKAPDVVHIPTVLGSVVIIQNTPGVSKLRLSPETLSGIYLGKITKWNDPALTAENPG